MQKTVDEFKILLDQSSKKLAAISESDSGKKSALEKWSKKEILGHLIDSAANNHQRFVRAQSTAELRIPGYEQQVWVTAQRYQNEPWADLVQLWKSYNLHLLHIISAIPERSLGNYCFIGDDKPVTLEFVIQDYVRHLKHHLEQILK
jgi:DinB superfamily